MIPVQSNRTSASQSSAAAVAAAAPEVIDRGDSLLEMLTNSADELTQSLSGKAQEKKLKERKAAESRPEGLTLERIEEVLEGMAEERQAGSSDDSKAQVERDAQTLANKLLRKPGLARQHAREGGGSSTEQYLQLLDIADRLASGQFGPDPGARAETAAREAAAELYAERGRDILADLNTFQATNALGADAEALRTDYKDLVFGEATVADLMRRLLERVPDDSPEKFVQTLDAARAAAGLDLAAARPSVDPVRLQALVADLNQMKVLGTIMEQCADLARTLQARHSVSPAPSPARLTRELVSVTNDRWVDANRFSKMAQDLGLEQPASASVDFLTGARVALRDLPPQIYASPEAREAILNAAQGALDHAIDREEGYA